MLLLLLVLEVLEVDGSGECELVSQVRLMSQTITGFCLSVRLPDLRQLRLFPELLGVVGAVLDSVGLVTSVVADWTNVNIEGGADHSTTGVLQNMGGVDCLRLVVVLQNTKTSKYGKHENNHRKCYLAKYAVSREFLGFLHFLLGLIFKSWRNVFKSAGKGFCLRT